MFQPLKGAARFCASLLLVAGITFFYRTVFAAANSTTVALTFLLAILGIATGWGLLEAIIASVAGMLCFNFFFLPPVGAFTITDPQNWVALFAFLVTAIVASHLSASARQRALEATRRRLEMERLYGLSRRLMVLDNHSATAGQVSHHIAQVFDLPGVAIFDRRTDRVYSTSPLDLPITDVKLRNLALQGTAFHDRSSNMAVLPLSLDGQPAGSLAIHGGSISDTAFQAIGNLASFALERSRAEETATRMEAARQNEEMKSMLLDALAHEFKTPLTSIKAAASSLMDEEPLAQKELVTIIEEEADRLDSLVSETIRMARIEAGDLDLQTQPQEICELIDSALEKLKIQLEDREIEIELPPGLAGVMADGELAGLAIRQLVTNALKYSNPESPIAIRACSQERSVRISVKDCGPGISPKDLPFIFDKYYRSADSSDRIPGTGIGLTIARDIVRAHDGEIWVESTPGEGSEFFLTLPALDRQ